MKHAHKQLIISAVTFIGGLYFFLEFILPEDLNGFKFGSYHEQISHGLQIIGVMAIGLGLINILRVHGMKLVRGGKNRFNSCALMLGLAAMLSVATADLINAEKAARVRARFDQLALFVQRIAEEQTIKPPIPRLEALNRALLELERLPPDPFNSSKAEELYKLSTLAAESRSRSAELIQAYRLPDAGRIGAVSTGLVTQLKSAARLSQEIASTAYEQSLAKRLSRFLAEGFFIPLGSSMFALLAFYIASAAYRSFRLRSVEATMMMIPAVLVILGQIPQGPLYIDEQLPAVRLWLMQNISTPAFRAIYFGSAVAGLAMAVRMWLSLEKSPLAVDGAGHTDSQRKE